MRYIVVLIVLSLLPLRYLAQPGLPVTHDGPDHVARIANFYQSLSEGNIVPRWAANLNWGYGHPVLMFLYPLPSYAASAFHAFGFSFVDSTKLVFAVSYSASILAMYAFLVNLVGIQPALVGALLYGFAPYRFVDLSVRGAIGEHVAFVFLPLILVGLDVLRREKTRSGFLITSVSTAALLLSHNAVSIMFVPVVVLYAAYLFVYKSQRPGRFLISAVYATGLGVGLASFFWMPAYFEGKYTLRDIVTAGEFSGRFVPWQRIISSPWSYGLSSELSHALGYLQWFSIGISLVIWRYIKERNTKVLLACLLVGTLLSLFLMTQWSAALWANIRMLQKFQFPWRFLTLAVFFSAVIGAVSFSALKVKSAILTVLLAVSILAATAQMWVPKAVQIISDDTITDVYPGTTDTGESSPIWSVRFMERSARAHLEIIEGAADIQEIVRLTTRHRYRVRASVRTKFVENTLYFPGWNVQIDGNAVPIEFQDPSQRGLMTFWVEPGDHEIDVVLHETKLRLVADTITFVSLGFIILGSTILGKRKKQ